MSTNPTPRPEQPTTETNTTAISARGGTDRWATDAVDTPEQRITPAVAPFTFDPFCTRRLRNCADAENAAMPDTDATND
jgi:hypothetical protein